MKRMPGDGCASGLRGVATEKSKQRTADILLVSIEGLQLLHRSNIEDLDKCIARDGSERMPIRVPRHRLNSALVILVPVRALYVPSEGRREGNVQGRQGLARSWIPEFDEHVLRSRSE